MSLILNFKTRIYVFKRQFSSEDSVAKILTNPNSATVQLYYILEQSKTQKETFEAYKRIFTAINICILAQLIVCFQKGSGMHRMPQIATPSIVAYTCDIFRLPSVEFSQKRTLSFSIFPKTTLLLTSGARFVRSQQG